MTNKKAIEVIRGNCYLFNPLNLDRTTLVNTALDTAIKALEQGMVLDKIRAEIAEKKQKINFKELDDYEKAQAEMRLSTLNEILQIIDKYKAESEDKT